jgi:hypothetical protein
MLDMQAIVVEEKTLAVKESKLIEAGVDLESLEAEEIVVYVPGVWTDDISSEDILSNLLMCLTEEESDEEFEDEEFED